VVARWLLFLITTCALVVAVWLHVSISNDLNALRVRLVGMLDEDKERWTKVQEKDLHGLRVDYDVASGLASDIAESHGLLRKTTSALTGGKEWIYKLVNRTQAFYGWVRNHLLLSHGITRGVSAPQLVKMCLPISITTRNSKWKRLEDMLLVTSFLPSLIKVMARLYVLLLYRFYCFSDTITIDC
jgi:hypothetical protein